MEDSTVPFAAEESSMGLEEQWESTVKTSFYKILNKLKKHLTKEEVDFT